jgi:hypothetical protein
MRIASHAMKQAAACLGVIALLAFWAVVGPIVAIMEVASEEKKSLPKG